MKLITTPIPLHDPVFPEPIAIPPGLVGTFSGPVRKYLSYEGWNSYHFYHCDGSNTGGIRETQDILEFCARNNIKPEITKIPMNGIDHAWQKVFDKQARYRFVIDMAG